MYRSFVLCLSPLSNFVGLGGSSLNSGGGGISGGEGNFGISAGGDAGDGE